MTAQNPLKDTILFLGTEFKASHKLTPEEQKIFDILVKSYKELYAGLLPWLPYQWAVWTTAWARYELEEAMKRCVTPSGICRLIYIDTDSLYYEGNHIDYSDYNNTRIKRSLKSGAWAKDSKGHPHYMGVLEEDELIDEFKTWGAKKYVYRRGDHYTCTISGVNKSEGAAELEEMSRISGKDVFEVFETGFVFHTAGGQESRYNDENYGWYHPDPEHQIYISTNLYLEDSTYTVNLSDDYAQIVAEFQRNPELCAKTLDMWEAWEYNKTSPVLD